MDTSLFKLLTLNLISEELQPDLGSKFSTIPQSKTTSHPDTKLSTIEFAKENDLKTEQILHDIELIKKAKKQAKKKDKPGC